MFSPGEGRARPDVTGDGRQWLDGRCKRIVGSDQVAARAVVTAAAVHVVAEVVKVMR